MEINGSVFIDGNSNSFKLDTNLANKEYSGIIITGILGESVTFGSLLYKNIKSHWYNANASSLDTMLARSVALSDGIANHHIHMLIFGTVRNDDWQFIKPSSHLYVSSLVPGLITDTVYQESNSILQSIGIKIKQNIVFFNFNSTWAKFV